MPTGYTYPVLEQNQSFEGFVWHCAQAFFRDPPTPLPLTKKWPYDRSHEWHMKMLDRAETRLAELRDTSEAEWSKKQKRSNVESLKQYEESRKQQEKENAALRKMLLKVEMWDPPTPDHRKLKEYMIDQLQISMSKPYDPPSPSTRTLAEVIAREEKEVEYHREQIQEIDESCEKRYEWIMALHRQIPRPSSKEILGR